MTINPAGFTGTVDDAEFAKIMSGGGAAGVLGTYNSGSFVATRSIGSRTVTLSAGELVAPGVYAQMDAPAAPAAAANNATGSNRIDTLVMRFDWGAGTAALVIVVGTTNPATLNTNPGVLYDVPLWRLVLAPGGSDYTVINIQDQRVFVRDGNLAQASGKITPPSLPGRTIIHPDTGLIEVGASVAGFWQYTPHLDTGTIPLAVTEPAGFSSGCTGRKINEAVTISLQMVRTGGAQTNLTLDSGLPPGWRPVDIDHTMTGWQDNTPVRIIAYRSGNLTLGPITTVPGAIIRAVLKFNVS